MSIPETAVLLMGDWRGIYLPKDFAVEFGDRVEYPEGQSPREDLATIMRGPDDDGYWDAWDALLDSCKLRLSDGVYTLYQDGDLWLVPDGAEWPEE